MAFTLILCTVAEAQSKTQIVYKNRAGATTINPSQTEPLPVSEPAILYYKSAYTTTVSTEVDTITAPTGTAYSWSFSITPNDTLEYSVNGNFANPIKIITAGTDGFTNFSVTNFPAVYIRRVGTGTVTYSYKAYGF